MDKEKIRSALNTINEAIIELNDGRTDTEDFYRWSAVLEIFDLDVNNGVIDIAKYPNGSYPDRNRFFTEWD